MSDSLIPLKSLPAGVHTFEFPVDGALFADAAGSGILDVALTAQVTVDHRPEGYLLALHVSGTVEVECDRCLDPMTLPVDAGYSVTVKYGQEHDEESADGLLTLAPAEAELDVAPMLRDTVILSIPATHSHAREEECNPAMRERLAAHSGRVESTGTDPRWSALKGLTDQN